MLAVLQVCTHACVRRADVYARIPVTRVLIESLFVLFWFMLCARMHANWTTELMSCTIHKCILLLHVI